MILQPGRLQAEQPAGLDASAHLGDHLLDQLMLPDGRAERFSLLRVGERCIQARLRQPDRPGCDREATLVDGAHGDTEALPLLADAILDRDPNIVHVDAPGIARMDAHLAVDGLGREALHATFQHERRDALVTP